jgi:hypothetical protein
VCESARERVCVRSETKPTHERPKLNLPCAPEVVRKRTERYLKEPRGRLTIHSFTTMTLPDLIRRFRHLPVFAVANQRSHLIQQLKSNPRSRMSASKVYLTWREVLSEEMQGGELSGTRLKQISDKPECSTSSIG